MGLLFHVVKAKHLIFISPISIRRCLEAQLQAWGDELVLWEWEWICLGQAFHLGGVVIPSSVATLCM